MNIEGVAFDLEGTIINVEPAHHLGWIRAAAEIGVHLASPEAAMEVIPNFSGGPERTVIEQIFKLLPDEHTPTEGEISSFHARKWACYEEILEEIDLSPRPGFVGVYNYFRSIGLPMTIGTAVELERALPLFRRSGVDRLFTLYDIVFMADVKNPKPAPDCFIETAHRMGINPMHQIVFEDSPRGVQAGFAAGSFVIGMPVYDTKLTRDRLMAAGACKIFMDWQEINPKSLLASF